ncbi:Cyclin-A2 [Coemansia guatemalensis]|uniref:Cyclin-A2 n=1 Tax=Coemansia guatemalensis TaxID=2761395 RepID=A0A9W8HNF8_9FUNG|nr:Cyclin-A2 [Coemansia guatemalensis]
MAQGSNKENAVCAVPHNLPTKGLHNLTAKEPRRLSAKEPHQSEECPVMRKRTIAEVEDGSCAVQVPGEAKMAIKRGCAEMGIRKHASLCSMSTKHTRAAKRQSTDSSRAACKRASTTQKPSRREAHVIKKPELTSEATVILLPSDADCREKDAAGVADSVSLESQITLVAPSSPARLGPELLPSEPPDFEPEAPCANDDLSSTHDELDDYLRHVEQKFGTGLECGLARHPDLSRRMRPILVDWLMEVAADYRMHRQTLHLTVQYLDRFLTNTTLQVAPSMLQCYGTACLSIAMKAEEQRAPSLSELTDFSKDAFSRDDLKQAEIDVLVALGWKLAVPTVFEFLCIMFQRAALHLPEHFADLTMPRIHARDGNASICPATISRRFKAEQFIAACDYADALLHLQDTLRFTASEIAAACFYLGTAPSSLDGAAFLQCTGYSFATIWPAVLHAKRLRSLLDPASATQLCARPCCDSKDRHSSHLKRIRAAELWAFQPHHAHLLGEFEDFFAAR